MSRDKEAEKIKLRKLQRMFNEERKNLEELTESLKTLRGEEKSEMKGKIDKKRIELALLRNKIAREKIKISKMR